MRALLAVDLDEDAGSVASGVARARTVLERLFATVDVLYVAEPLRPLPTDDRASELTQLVEAAIARWEEEQLTRLRAFLATWPEERRGEVELARGRRPAREIASRATGHDLLVVGTHARRGLGRAWLGSVAELVVRSSPIPVLVLHGHDTPLEGVRIVAAVDALDMGSPAVLAEAARFASRVGAKVDMVHVVSPESANPGLLSYETPWSGDHAIPVPGVEQRLDALVETVPAAVRGAARVVRGDPAYRIVEAAKGHMLLALGTHGRRGVDRMLLGSVAERVVRRCEVPVLVIPTNT